MKKLAFISDIFFAFLCVFLFSLCLLRYLGVSLSLSFILAVVCGALAGGSVSAILLSKRKYSFMKKSDEAQKQKLFLHLALLSDQQKGKFFLSVLSKDTPARPFSRLHIVTNEAFYCIRCDFQPVNSNEVGKFYRLKTGKRRVLLCPQIDEQAFLLCQKLGIEVKTGDELYTLIKESDAMPKQFLGEEKESVNKRRLRLRICFSKTNSKHFLISGALILLTSLFTPFPYYYLIFGSILLLTATAIRIFGYK